MWPHPRPASHREMQQEAQELICVNVYAQHTFLPPQTLWSAELWLTEEHCTRCLQATAVGSRTQLELFSGTK